MNTEQYNIPIINKTDPAVLLETLKQTGALLLRGSNSSVEDFERLSDRMMIPMIHHATSTIERNPVNSDATTSTVNKGQDAIPLHREGSYAPGCPDILMLYCVTPSSCLGQTTLCDGVQLLESLCDQTRHFVEQAVLKWSWQAPPSRWKATLACDLKEDAIAKLEFIQSKLPAWEHLEFKFEDEILNGSFLTPCAIPTKWGASKAFCNSLLIYYLRSASPYFALQLFRVTLSDGSPFPSTVLQEISTQANRMTDELDWQPRDIAIIDNSRWMHGRRSFEDVDRNVLIRMGHLIP